MTIQDVIEKNGRSKKFGFYFYAPKPPQKQHYFCYLVNPYKQDFFILNKQSVTENTMFVENAYIVDLFLWPDTFSHYSLLRQCLGGFEIVKQNNPKIKLVIAGFDSLLNDPINIKILEDLKNIYNLKSSDIIYLDFYKMITFKNIHFLPFQESIMFKAINGLTDVVENYDNLKAFQQFISKSLKNKILKNKKIVKNKKIFISRKAVNDKKRNIHKEINNKILISPDLILSKDAQDYINKRHMALVNQYAYRFISEVEEDLLENFFIKMGYEIVVPDNMGIIDQAEVFASATHVAGLSGGGFVNTIFCDKKTKITVINRDTVYKHAHALLSSATCDFVKSLPSTDGIKEKRQFSIEEILNELLINEEYLQ